MTIHGGSASGSASTTAAVWKPPDLPGGRDLAGEPAAELGVVGVFGPDELDRYLPAAGGRAEEHLRHAARAEPAEQPVTADKLGIARLEGIHRSTLPSNVASADGRTLHHSTVGSEISQAAEGADEQPDVVAVGVGRCHEAGSGNADRPDARIGDALRERADVTGI